MYSVALRFPALCVCSKDIGGKDASHPNDSGFQRFAGSRANLGNCFDWAKLEDGVVTKTTTYATKDTADEAIEAILTMHQPFCLHLGLRRRPVRHLRRAGKPPELRGGHRPACAPFDDPGLILRPTVFSESLPNSNDTLPFTRHECAVRDSR